MNLLLAAAGAMILLGGVAVINGYLEIRRQRKGQRG